MKKLLITSSILIFSGSIANAGDCHLQRNPIGFENYEVCEVRGSGYTCVSLENKTRGGISCFPTQKIEDDHSSGHRPRSLSSDY